MKLNQRLGQRHQTDVALTQNVWTRLCPADPSRLQLRLQNLDADSNARIVRRESPWCLTFDGTEDFLTLDDGVIARDELGVIIEDEAGVPVMEDGRGLLTDLQSSLLGGSVDIEFNLDTVTAAAVRVLVGFADLNADTFVYFGLNVAGQVCGLCKVAGVTQWAFHSVEALTALEWHSLRLVHNQDEVVAVLNGSELFLTWDTETDKTAWLDDLGTAMDTVTVGCVNTNSAGAALFFDGKIGRLAFYAGHAATKQELAWFWFQEGTGTVAKDEAGRNLFAFMDTGDPAWASFSPGYHLPAGTSDFEQTGEDPRLPAWGLTADTGVTITVAESF